MFVTVKNGNRWNEYTDFGRACAAARLDAIHSRLSDYAIWDRATLDQPIRKQSDKPLYRIVCGVSYSTAQHQAVAA